MKHFIKKNHASYNDTLIKEAKALEILSEATEAC